MNDAGIYETKEISYKSSLAVNFLYLTLPGRMLLRQLIKPGISKFVGNLMDCSFSRLFVPVFIRCNRICMDDYKDESYKSFNDFFTREVKTGARPISLNGFDVIAPCDGKLTAYPIADNQVFRIKNTVYDVSSLLADEKLAGEFADGICLIFRLTPDDYHRYCYIDDGQVVFSKKIKGVLHTVRPIALQRYNVYAQNTREYTVIQTENFGKVVQMEVGALFIGRIVNHMTDRTFMRGQEKGMFEFGGSTVVLLFQKNKMIPDKIICQNTLDSKETVVRMGNKIGVKNLSAEEGLPCLSHI